MEKKAVGVFLKKQVPLFATFSEETLTAIVEASRLASYNVSEAIIEYGSVGQFLGVMLEGEARASIIDDGGEERAFGQLEPGRLFGEMALMTGDPTVANVIAVTPCQVLLIPQAVFSAQLGAHPAAISLLVKMISERSTAIALDQMQSMKANALSRAEDPYGFKLKTESPAKILVINCGSSSLKYNLFDTADESHCVSGTVERIGMETTRHAWRAAGKENAEILPRAGHGEAFQAMVRALTDSGMVTSLSEITLVGHRVVHGGDRFSHSVVITPAVLDEIDRLSPLAPLHNPVNALGIREAQKLFPHAPQVAVFDTAFHHTLPDYAYLYGLPRELAEDKKIRRYGFHGTSHRYVTLKAAEYLKRSYASLELVSCHLGNGASVCAVDHGRSIDTSMGFTPAEGLIMGTRSGDVDPAVLIHLMRHEGYDADALDRLINKESGLKGLSGLSSDMREVERAADAGDLKALTAIKAYGYRVRKYIGAYIAAMEGVDAIIFTGGIGQNSAGLRWLACQGLACMGIVLDEEKNRAACGQPLPVNIAAAGSRVAVLVVPTDEERMIARESLRTLEREKIALIVHGQEKLPIPVEVSARHIHLSQAHVEALFGPGHTLTPAQELSQPGQFACVEKVHLVGPKGRVENVRVLGPTRKETQVEVAMTEQFKLGIHPPIRESGDLEGSPGIMLEGTAGSTHLHQGVICAQRHIHMTPEDALRLGLRDRYVVRVRVEGDRELIFGDVVVRVNPSYRLAMHIDTDEGNAANIKPGAVGVIEAIQSRGQ